MATCKECLHVEVCDKLSHISCFISSKKARLNVINSKTAPDLWSCRVNKAT